MSLAVLPDHRHIDDRGLLRALGNGDPLALVEVGQRTAAAATACARRLFASPGEVEALLCAVYRALWDEPPDEATLERWVRARCFAVGSRHLRELGGAPASPSIALLLPDLPSVAFHPSDPTERTIAALDPAARRALVLAHDRGVPTSEQPQPGAAAALHRALLTLAGPDQSEDAAGGDASLLGDFTLGLLPAERRVEVAARLEASPRELAVAAALRRGRRRLDGGQPSGDLIARVLVSVLTGPLSRVGRAAGVALPATDRAGEKRPDRAGQQRPDRAGEQRPDRAGEQRPEESVLDGLHDQAPLHPRPVMGSESLPTGEGTGPSWRQRAAVALAVAGAAAASVYLGLQGNVVP